MYNFINLFFMKTLNLNAYGVEEMSMNEMETVDGGIGLLAAFGIGVAVGFILYLIFS
jgi:hypothetical protein